MSAACPLCKGRQGALFLGRPKRGNIKARILEVIESAGPQGLTVDDLEQLLSLPHQTVSARVHELWRSQQISTAKKRQNPSGRPARVWCARGTAHDVDREASRWPEVAP